MSSFYCHNLWFNKGQSVPEVVDLNKRRLFRRYLPHFGNVEGEGGGNIAGNCTEGGNEKHRVSMNENCNWNDQITTETTRELKTFLARVL